MQLSFRLTGLICLLVTWSAFGVETESISPEAQQKVEALQQQAKQKNWHFAIGYHPQLDYDQLHATGYVPREGWEHKAVFYQPRKLRLPATFDWRKEANGLTPIKNQGQCGSCWAFGTVGALEQAVKIKDHVVKTFSEQQLVDCFDGAYGCGGGTFAHEIHMSPGAAPDSEYPYTASNGYCQQKSDYETKLSSWGYVGGQNASPTDEQLKQAIYQYGPVAATVSATDSFQAYSGGIYDACDGGQINHIVDIVGWDDTQGVWIMRNSWGTQWGEQGYMRIKYGCNSLGQQATFVVYKPTCSPQPAITAGDDRAIAQGGAVHIGSMPVVGQTYSWSPATGLDDPSAAMPLASPTQTTTYTLKVTTSCATATQSVTVTVGGR